MKKFFLTLALAAVATSAFAQIDGLSVSAGYQSYTLHQDYSTTIPIVGTVTLKSDNAFGGFYAGVNYSLLTFGPGISVTPGLYFSTASYKNADNADVQAKQSYIGVPVNFSYFIDLVPGTLALEPYAGPIFSYGLSYKGTGNNWTDTTNYYTEDYDYGRFNVALGAGLALNIAEMIRVNIGYNYYLLNLYTGDGDGNVNRNGVLNFGVSYVF